MNRKITVNATGCCLCDKLVNGIDFFSPEMARYLSIKQGDGGILPGQLTFKEDLERFSNRDIDTIINEITNAETTFDTNIGGPSIIALICAAQLMTGRDVTYNFFQNHGDDSNGHFIVEQLQNFAPGISLDHYVVAEGETAETLVLSDPDFNSGEGERSFINSLGNAGQYSPIQLTEDFYTGDILLFGATALTPLIHKRLGKLLKKGKDAGRITIVTTVYDFISEKKNPGHLWPMGKCKRSYRHMDLLICNLTEALSITGTNFKEQAAEQFRKWGLPALIITDGLKDVAFYALKESIFFPVQDLEKAPILDLDKVTIPEMDKSRGDTTGCGDNFAGGVLTRIISSLMKNEEKIDLKEAVTMGICTGASACYYLGGMMKENRIGQKTELVQRLKDFYTEQILENV